MGPGVYLVSSDEPYGRSSVLRVEGSKRPATAEELVERGASGFLSDSDTYTLYACVPIGQFTKEFHRVAD